MAELLEKDRLHISVSGAPVGTLGRGQSRIDSVFAYAEDALEENAVSLTMPARLESYTWDGIDVAMAEMAEYIKVSSVFAEVGEAMMEQWKSGVARSLVKS